MQDRSKAYLDANCAHCHNRKGAADTSGLDLALEKPVGRSYGSQQGHRIAHGLCIFDVRRVLTPEIR